MIKSDKEEIFAYVRFAGVVEAKVLFAWIEEKTGDGKPRKVDVSGRRGVLAVLAASGHTGKDRDLVIKFAPWRSLVPLTIAVFKGQ